MNDGNFLFDGADNGNLVGLFHSVFFNPVLTLITENEHN